MHILLLEDDTSTSDYLKKNLASQGHEVELAIDGVHGQELAESKNYDAMIIDRMLPQRDGLAVIRQLRAQNNTTPVLVLSALAEVTDRVEGLQAGADDYLVKPFAFAELLARLDALTRRTENESATHILKVGPLELDLLSRQVTRNNISIDLMPREFRLLEYMMRHADQVITRSMLLENVWDYNFDPQTNVIDVHISRLRSKIDKDFDTSMLLTVRGAGYCLKTPTNIE